MEILNKPIYTEDRKYNVVCQKCHADLVFKRSESIITETLTGEELVIICPVCETQVTKTTNFKIDEPIIYEEKYNRYSYQ